MILLKNAGVIPALEDVLTRPEARAVGDPTLTRVRELHLVARPVQTPYYPQVSKALYTRANAVIGGRATPAQALRAPVPTSGPPWKARRCECHDILRNTRVAAPGPGAARPAVGAGDRAAAARPG